MSFFAWFFFLFTSCGSEAIFLCVCRGCSFMPGYCPALCVHLEASRYTLMLELVYCSLVSTDDCILLELFSNVFLGYHVYLHSHCSFAFICALSMKSAECIIHCYLCVFRAQQLNVFEISGKYIFTNAILHEQELTCSIKQFASQNMVRPAEIICKKYLVLLVVLWGLYFISHGRLWLSHVSSVHDCFHRC